MSHANEQPPEVRLGAALDRIDAEAAESLLGALDSDPRGLNRFRAYVRQKRLLRRSANALERDGSARTDALARRLDRRLGMVRAGRWTLGLAAALAVGWGLGEISDQITEPNAYYGFETADARVVTREPVSEVSLALADATPQRLSAWIGRPVSPPDFRRLGLTFEGARLVDTGEVKLVGLVYNSRAGRLVLCQSADLDGQRERPEMLRTAAVQAGYWSDGQKTFALIGDLSRSRIDSLVRQTSSLTMPEAPSAG
jgi:anti-sigma factor RsiW